MNNLPEYILKKLPLKLLLILVLPLVVLEPVYKELKQAWGDLDLKYMIKKDFKNWKGYWKENL